MDFFVKRMTPGSRAATQALLEVKDINISDLHVSDNGNDRLRVLSHIRYRNTPLVIEVPWRYAQNCDPFKKEIFLYNETIKDIQDIIANLLVSFSRKNEHISKSKYFNISKIFGYRYSSVFISSPKTFLCRQGTLKLHFSHFEYDAESYWIHIVHIIPPQIF